MRRGIYFSVEKGGISGGIGIIFTMFVSSYERLKRRLIDFLKMEIAVVNYV